MTALVQTGHSKSTITDYYTYYWQLITEDLDIEDTKIGGQNVVVEIDKSKFGKHKNNCRHYVKGVWVLGGVELTDEYQMFLVPVPCRDTTTLLHVISEHVHPGSIIYTDCW